MSFEKESLDLVLVPCGLIMMFVYHIVLLYRYLHYPETTVMGFENHNKRAWVERVMELNDVAATFLASISLTLSSLIGAWIASNNNNNVFESDLIYGDTTFSCFVQSIRSFIHANYLISMPNSNTPTYYVEVAVIRGGEFWQLGLRALYFALILLLWFFGPIPMFVSSFFMVVLLCYLDSNSTPLHYFEAPSKLRGQRSITTMVASYDN
ncbi:ABC transporter NFT1 [Bienertia sinuspersici]